MNKPIVFLTPEQIEAKPWSPFADGPDGVWERVLSRDEESGSYTRLIKADPGLVVSDVRVHEFWEESYILEGTFEEGGVTYGPGTYVCNPPGHEHGPYTTSTGWLALEWVHYEEPGSS